MAKLKRNRQIRTCEYCYSHKLKCDRNSPCSTCIRTKSDCVYQFKKTGKPIKTHGGPGLGLVTEDPETAVANPTAEGETVRLMSQEYDKSGPLKKGTANGKASTGMKKPHSKEAGGAKKDITFFSNTNNTPLYYSRAFFPYLEPSLNRMFLFKLSEVGENGLKPNFSHTGTYDFQRFGLKITLKQLFDEYPKKEEFDDVIYLYWDYIYPLIPVIDKETVMNNYIRFWKDLQNQEDPKFDIDVGVLLLAMLLAVKIAFEVNEDDKVKLEALKEEKNRIYDTFEKFKLIFGFRTNPNLAYIQASIILFQSSCLYYMGIFTYTAALTRQAEFMGLHRDPLLHDVYPNKRNIKDVEVRRVVWHYIRLLDTATSLVSGMSPHMIMTNASTKFPSKRDYNLETQKYDGDLNPFMIFTISRFKCSLVMETISHYLNSDFSSENEKILRWEGISRTVIALYEDVNTLVKEIFSCATNPKYSKVLIRWLVSNTAILVHRTYLLHRACDRRPYSHHNRVILKPENAANIELTKLSHANSSKDFFEKVLTIRMPYYEAVIEVSILLLYESKIRIGVSPELSKFRWFTKNANPFQYIYFVLRDVHHYPDKRYKFTHVPQEIKNFIFEDDLLTYDGDIRRYTIDLALNSLIPLKAYWCDPISDMMNFLCELRKYVYKSISVKDHTNQFQNEKLQQDNDLKINKFDDLIGASFEADKYKDIFQLLSNLNSDPALTRSASAEFTPLDNISPDVKTGNVVENQNQNGTIFEATPEFSDGGHSFNTQSDASHLKRGLQFQPQLQADPDVNNHPQSHSQSGSHTLSPSLPQQHVENMGPSDDGRAYNMFHQQHKHVPPMPQNGPFYSMSPQSQVPIMQALQNSASSVQNSQYSNPSIQNPQNVQQFQPMQQIQSPQPMQQLQQNRQNQQIQQMHQMHQNQQHQMSHMPQNQQMHQMSQMPQMQQMPHMQQMQQMSHIQQLPQMQQVPRIPQVQQNQQMQSTQPMQPMQSSVHNYPMNGSSAATGSAYPANDISYSNKNVTASRYEAPGNNAPDTELFAPSSNMATTNGASTTYKN